MKFISKSDEETQDFGQRLAKELKPGDVVLLVGDLGTGKTTFVKGVARGLRMKPDAVHSPTFVLMNIYEGRLPLFHFDLYRLEPGDELNRLGFEEFLYGEGVALIEWADRMGAWTPPEYLRLELKHDKDDRRILSVKAQGVRYKKLLANLGEK